MGLFDQFPYTNFHELNLDWILQALKELEHTIEQFVSINALKYADPIQWNITSQYEKNTIVIDGQTGIAYISVAPVPSGIALSNTDYWTPVFDLSALISDAGRNLTLQVEGSGAIYSTFNLSAGDWVVWNGVLYEALVTIPIGTLYAPGTNIKRITVEEMMDNILATVNTLIGNLNNLTTTDKTNVVSAINEVVTDISNTVVLFNNIIGNLNNLTTTDKTNVVSAVNEINARINNLKSPIYVNVKDYGAKGDGVTDDTSAINAAKAVAESYPHGATLFFPAGDYLISDTLVFNYVSGKDLFGVSILGEGKYQSIIFSNSDIDLIKYEGDNTLPNDASHLFGIKIADIYLKYYGGNSTKAGLTLINCNLVLVENVRIRYFKAGVYLDDCTNSVFFAVGISGNVESARGFDVGNVSVSNYYIACFFAASGTAGTLTGDAVGFYAARGSIADQNILFFEAGGSCVSAIRLNGENTTQQQTGDINIFSLVCETYYGVEAYNIANHGNINIIGGWFNCTGERHGIFLSNCTGVNINNVVFVNNIGSGSFGLKSAITLTGTSNKNIKINGCLFKNQYALNANVTGKGLLFANNVVEVEDTCLCEGSLVGSNLKNTIISNNVFNGPTLRCVRLYSGATYSLCTNNVADGQATGTAFQNDAGATSVLDNNLNG